MTLNPPTANDIAKLFLLCAPPDALENLELSEDTQEDFADRFNALNNYSKTGVIALALYYAGRTLINFKKSYSLVSTLYISPEVLYELIQLVNAESFADTEGLLLEIEKEEKSKIGRKAVNSRHNKPGGSREKRAQIRALWATGKYSTKDICAEEEYAGLGYKTFGAARKALRDPKTKT